ncbi:hypothetical protein CERSUDRAFT_35492, partial [Gelatoporia subvermispora B]
STLRGFHIPGVPKRLVTNLFADDTTAFLSEQDDFTTLTSILQKWCTASRARFNIPKTFVLPIGTPEYRGDVLTSRRTNPGAAPFPPTVSLVPEGTAIRLLGAWIGNGADQASIWTPTVEKISTSLNIWSSRGPSLKGKSLVSKFVMGGMTQYLTVVQGMPTDVRKRLTAILMKFVWNGRSHSPPVGRRTLYRLWTEGGLN